MAGECVASKAFLEEALAILVNEQGENNGDVARVLINLGASYAGLGKYKKSLKRLKKALRIIEGLFIEERDKLILKGKCLCNLGEVHRLNGSLGKY